MGGLVFAGAGVQARRRAVVIGKLPAGLGGYLGTAEAR